MIHAYIRGPEARVVATTLPTVGEVISLVGFGEVWVIGLTHDAHDNYIELRRGDYSFRSPFTVEDNFPSSRF